MNEKKRPVIFDKKEQMIREQRTIDAMRNGLMGSEGKLVRIAKAMGEPIYRHGTSNFNQNFLDDPYELPSEDLPTMDEEEMSYQIGCHYDGMRRGMHLEVIWQAEFREIKCYYKGRLVYREIAGELDGYAPGEWEPVVESLYEQTRRRERDERKIQTKTAGIEARREQNEFLEAMKLKWGI